MSPSNFGPEPEPIATIRDLDAELAAMVDAIRTRFLPAAVAVAEDGGDEARELVRALREHARGNRRPTYNMALLRALTRRVIIEAAFGSADDHERIARVEDALQALGANLLESPPLR